jgi:hypothetical protein
MKARIAFFCLLVMSAGALTLLAQKSSSNEFPADQNWTNYVRIGAYGLKGGDALEIVRRAQEERRIRD